jgi:GT2 family glycosyltransferase
VASFNATKRREVEIAPGGNMSFRREVLIQIRGFDEGFEGNGYFFETDGSLRVLKAGYRMVFDPQAELKHLMAPSGGARIRDKATHHYYFVRNGLRLFRRHSPAVFLPICLVRMLTLTLAKAAYRLDWRTLSEGMRGIWDGLHQSMELRSHL